MLLKIIMTLVLIGSAIVGGFAAREEEEGIAGVAFGTSLGIMAGCAVSFALYAIWMS